MSILYLIFGTNQCYEYKHPTFLPVFVNPAIWQQNIVNFVLWNERTSFRDILAKSFNKRAFCHFWNKKVEFSPPFSVTSVAYCLGMAVLKLKVTIVPIQTSPKGHETLLYQGFNGYSTFILGPMIAWQTIAAWPSLSQLWQWTQNCHIFHVVVIILFSKMWQFW